VVCPQLPAEHPRDNGEGEGGRPQPAWTGTGPGGLGAEAMIANGIAMRRSNPVRSADFYVRRPTVRYATKVAVS
jgi:hypothetical protein